MHRTTASLLFGLTFTGTLADSLSTYEFVAFQDASIALCSANEPAKAKVFEKLRNPPYACAKHDESIAKQARQSPEYQAMRGKLVSQMESATKEQRAQFCRSLLEAKCGA
jgi:hypothetical protein